MMINKQHLHRRVLFVQRQIEAEKNRTAAKKYFIMMPFSEGGRDNGVEREHPHGD